jgi:carboxylate-amine ligase
MGDSQKLAPDEQLALAREQFEEATDYTLAVEEEFAVLHPETLTMENRFLELQAAAAGTPLEEHLVGELIASEVEVKTGRCETFAEAAALLGERRAQLLDLADGLGIALGGTGAHPWANWKDQTIIDTPHYRRNDEILRYVVWRNNTFGIHVHVAVRGADRAIKVHNALRNWMPELLALSASSPFNEEVYTHLHSVRTQIFTKFFPRCGIPDEFPDWAAFERYVRYLYATGSIDEHTQLWWSVRPHLAFPTVEMRICDAQPELAEARSLAALIYALTVRVAQAVDEGEPLPSHPRHLLEENFWRAIRYGWSGDFLDLSKYDHPVVRPVRQALEELVEWVLPAAEETGAAPYIVLPERNAAQRQIDRFEEGVSLYDIYAEQVRRTRDVALEPTRG